MVYATVPYTSTHSASPWLAFNTDITWVLSIHYWICTELLLELQLNKQVIVNIVYQLTLPTSLYPVFGTLGTVWACDIVIFYHRLTKLAEEPRC